MKKQLKRVISVAAAASMALTMSVPAFAANATYTVPTSPLTVDENLILCAAHAQADVSPEILGITNTTDRANEVPNDYDLDKAQTSALMGTFGGDINEAPNPYLYNWRYNSYAAKNGLPLAEKHTLGGIGGHPNSVDAEIVDSLGTSRSLYYRPDILVGTALTGSNTSGYEELAAQLPENQDSDTTNDYKPYVINYAMSRTYDFLDTLNDLANTCQQITAADSAKHTRYGDPTIIAGDVAKYAKGLQCYVLDRLEKDNAAQKTVAIVDPINSKDGTFLAVDENTSVQGTTTNSRAGEFLADTTENIVQKLGKTATTGNIGTAEKTYYTLTAKEILQADVIVISGVQNQDSSESAFREELIKYLDPSDTALAAKAENVPIMSTRFSCCGSIGANSVENVLGMAYWTAFCYPEYMNPVYVATYWYKNFYHITDNTSLKTIIATNFASASIPAGYDYTTDITNFDEEAVEDMIVDGMNYYEKNKDSLTGLLLYNNGNNGEASWVIDWTKGIGAGRQEDPLDRFNDLTSDWYKDAVRFVVANGYFQGYNDTTFAPQDTMTRAMFVTVLSRMAKMNANDYSGSSFRDVPTGEWYSAPVEWASKNGIVNGYGDGIFGLNNPVSRQEMATIMYRYAEKSGVSVTGADTAKFNSFSDRDSVADWAVNAVTWATDKSVINGTASGSGVLLDPNGKATRAQVAQIVKNYSDHVK